ncbi:AMP-binding protein [Blastococcus sp. TML/M2B]|uniref:class I adenylate-forming enzyme family protein n=1 Tax=Blastococcus sp. TML/M2B TaxID=2798727 RepID=UPI00190B4B6F|nr:AMP-binding protein [Blastococcus sp. TML/M2B]MBN1093065.1 AMP-binding protein [Blastococcus sp. TML/M2B]
MAQVTSPGQMFELAPWTRPDGVTYEIFKNAPPSMREIFALCRAHGDAPYLVFGEERRSFNQTFAEADAFAAALVERYGVQKGDRVAIAMRNFPEWVEAFIAILSIGAISVSMNAWWTEDELDFALEDSGATVIVADEQRAALAAASARRLGARTVVVRASAPIEGADRWEDVVVTGTPLPDVTVDPEDDATILYTSGTTGRPKGAVSTQRALVNTVMGFLARGAVAALVTPPEDPDAPPGGAILAVPLFHVTGCVAVMLGSLVAGRKLAIMYKWDPEAALKLIESERLSAFVGVPTQSIDMLQHPRFAEFDTSSLLSVGGGGAPTPPALIANIDNSFKAATPGFSYGMTETNALGPSLAGQEALDKPMAAGRVPLPMQAEIRDPSTFEVLPVGERGEIWFRGVNLIRGYWNRPDATAETIVDGWLRTGDIGHLDDEGLVYVDDRLKDMVLRGGENVYCAAGRGRDLRAPRRHGGRRARRPPRAAR